MSILLAFNSRLRFLFVFVYKLFSFGIYILAGLTLFESSISLVSPTSLAVKTVIPESQNHELITYNAAVHEVDPPLHPSIHELPHDSSISLALPAIINKTHKIILIINMNEAINLAYILLPPHSDITTPQRVNANCTSRKYPDNPDIIFCSIARGIYRPIKIIRQVPTTILNMLYLKVTY